MTCHIDQSNKIEQTEKDTIMALSNGVKFTILIRAKDKRVIQNEFRIRGRPKNFILFTFSILLIFLLKKVKPVVPIVIDLEYKDGEKIIWDRLIEYSRSLDYKLNRSLISFKSVGKRSPAHRLAGKVSAGKQNPDLRVGTQEILEVIFPKKKIGHPRGPRSV